jgi:hypothetical protein
MTNYRVNEPGNKTKHVSLHIVGCTHNPIKLNLSKKNLFVAIVSDMLNGSQ